MSTPIRHETLEEHLRSAPGDRESWLVYADWLMQQGDAHGETLHIALQIEQFDEEAKHTTPSHKKLKERVSLQEKLHIALTKLGAHAFKNNPHIWEGLPCFPHKVTLWRQEDLRSFAQMRDKPEMRFLTEVCVHELPARTLPELASLLPGTSIRALKLEKIPLDAAAVGHLAKDHALRDLTRLDLRSARMGEEGIRALFAHGPLPKLAQIEIGDNNIGNKGLVHLLACAPTLTVLGVGDNRLDDTAMIALAAAPSLGKLTALDLGENQISDQGLSALVGSGVLASVEVLKLSDNELGPNSAVEISAGCSRLTTLHLLGNRIGDAGADSLVNAENLRSLRSLDLSANDISDVGAASIAGATHLSSLELLDLSYNRITDTGARALAETHTLGALRTLKLVRNRIGIEGAEALVRSDGLVGLTALDLSGNLIRYEEEDRIAPRRRGASRDPLRSHRRLHRLLALSCIDGSL